MTRACFKATKALRISGVHKKFPRFIPESVSHGFGDFGKSIHEAAIVGTKGNEALELLNGSGLRESL